MRLECYGVLARLSMSYEICIWRENVSSLVALNRFWSLDWKSCSWATPINYGNYLRLLGSNWSSPCHLSWSWNSRLRHRRGGACGCCLVLRRETPRCWIWLRKRGRNLDQPAPLIYCPVYIHITLTSLTYLSSSVSSKPIIGSKSKLSILSV